MRRWTSTRRRLAPAAASITQGSSISRTTRSPRIAARPAAAFYSAGGSLTAVNATIAQNSASAGGHGGGLDVAGGAVTIYNTIVASNVKGSVTPDDIYPLSAGIVSLNSSFNLIGTGANGVLTNGVNGNSVGVSSAHLGALADNGGPVQTIALLTGSPAIDGGSNYIAGSQRAHLR